MQVFYSDNSPYARIVRVAAREARLHDRITWVRVRNRAPGSPLLAYSPVCRVPTLVEGDLVLGEARNICDYFGGVAGGTPLLPDESDWAARGLESMMTGFLDGIAVWVRELRRSVPHRSDFLLDVEAKRANRCLGHFEVTWKGLDGPPEWDFGHMALACALDIADLNALMSGWPHEHPTLASWFADRRTRPSMIATKPLQGAHDQTPLG
ncbi:MAG: glutathione S-transferase family protein [Pseudomonadota bacterium]